ncbi:MAG: PglZ domain-containing protein [Coriobacteriia bacterium]|nr:PglZ domain-containing protein [Coriobacteriia bacterium]
MTHSLSQYLHQQLGDKLSARRVVVFYDPRQEFGTFFERELEVVGDGYGGVPRVLIGGELTFLVKHEGSYFETRARIEPIVCADAPERLVVYVPGAMRTRETSVLMEIEKGGVDYAPQPKGLAREVLRKSMTDGEIDGILRSNNLTYDDMVKVLESGDEGSKSVLRSIFGGKQSESLLAYWLADPVHDLDIESKGALAELRVLVESRIGLSLGTDASIDDCRKRTVRYVLVNEFRSDLVGDGPDEISMVAAPSNKDQLRRVRDLASMLRSVDSDAYIDVADGVETEMGLAASGVEAAALGSIDTFRFEERLLLSRASSLLAARDYDGALDLVLGRAHSFWADLTVQRQAQWQACRLSAELGVAIAAVSGLLPTAGKPEAWIKSYAVDDEWFGLDQAHRRMETWFAGMDEEPETEQGIAVVRAEYDALLKRMTEGFVAAAIAGAWDFSGVPAQARVYADVVAKAPGRVAYFMVDSLRYEMGVELSRRLGRAEELRVTPAVASLPSITPVGMASLLPDAASDLSVVAHKGKVAARIGTSVLSSASDRMNFLKARIPDAIDMPLGELITVKAAALAKRIGKASVVVVRSQEIDFAGETDSDLLARQVMDSVTGNLVRAVNKLADAGVEHFVVSADHGHLFSVRKDDDMKTEAPGGDTVELHRRCWIGRGGSTPAGAVRVTGTELGYDTDLDFIFPVGAGVFRAGGGLSYHHGGVSLQEMVIPVISFKVSSRQPTTVTAKTVELKDVPARLTNRTFSVTVNVGADLFSDEAIALRIILLAGGAQVGHAGMALGAELDTSSDVLTAQPGASISLGMMLLSEDIAGVRVLVMDPATDAVLAQSDEIPVELGI